MKLYFKYMSILLKSQMQYRASFWLLSIGQFLCRFQFLPVFTSYLSVLAASGDEFSVALCFGVINMAFQ